MTNENQQPDENFENCGSVEILDELKNPKKFCNSRCTICASGILPQIHEWRKEGKHFDRIVELAAEFSGVNISAPSLCRHFQSYNKWKTDQATLIIKNDALEEITQQSVHIKKTVELLDIAYEQLLVKFKSGLYKIDVADLEKLTKMRYQILNGADNDEKDLMAIFQKASDDYGLNVQQGVLFKM